MCWCRGRVGGWVGWLVRDEPGPGPAPRLRRHCHDRATRPQAQADREHVGKQASRRGGGQEGWLTGWLWRASESASQPASQDHHKYYHYLGGETTSAVRRRFEPEQSVRVCSYDMGVVSTACCCCLPALGLVFTSRVGQRQQQQAVHGHQEEETRECECNQ